MNGMDLRLALASTLGLGLIAALAWATGLENYLAQLLYDPASAWALDVRTDSVLAMQIGLVGCLVVAMAPFSHSRRPLLVRTCALVLLTAALGAGLLNQGILKDVIDRARPRETPVLIGDLPVVNGDGFHGNAMPSGHAGFAMLLAVPFVSLRRERPKLAQGFLLAGSVATAVVGVSRMVLGAHFVSDILVAAGLTMLTAIGLDALLRRYGCPRPWVWLGIATATAAGMVMFNHFSMTYSYPLPPDFRHFDLPCSVTVVNDPLATSPLLNLNVDAYGAPKSLLSVVNENGVVRLDRGLGIFHTLTCEGTLQQQAE